MVKSAFLKLFLEAKKKMFNPIQGSHPTDAHAYQSFLALGQFFGQPSRFLSGLVCPGGQPLYDQIFPFTVTG
jgi:hypothetical protein